MEDNSMNSGWMIGLVVGAAVGAIVGLILAPASGEETRRRIRDVAGKLTDEGRKRMDDARDFAGEHVGDLRDAFRAGKEAYQQARAGHQTDQGPDTGS
jgi:gas vesicle protein